MSQIRLAPIPGEHMTADQQRVAEALINGPRGAVRGPFPALLRRPELADRIRAVGDYIRSNDTITFELREVAILTVARYWNASYEWGAHVKIAHDEGIDPVVVKAIKDRTWSENDISDNRLVHDFCVELLRDQDVSDSTYGRILSLLGEEALVDLLGIVGYFTFACMIFNISRMPASNPAMELERHR
jgi:4-carboxymuconolactone decarboxylase